MLLAVAWARAASTADATLANQELDGGVQPRVPPTSGVRLKRCPSLVLSRICICDWTGVLRTTDSLAILWGFKTVRREL